MITPEQGWQAALTAQLGIELWRIPVVIASAVGIYIVFLGLVRVFGVRVLRSWTTVDAITCLMFGAVAGRVIIGHPPSLAAGVIGLTTLMVMEVIFGAITGSRRGRTLVQQPVVIVKDGLIREEELHHAHMHRSQVLRDVRRAGLSSLDQVQWMILEADGQVSTYRVGIDVDPALLEGVRGVES
ncbi:DUF421 domain-containing protein [Corynebacterium renale]|uniref:Uncharacterized protein DUF421 n=1 Tax=Corynebacterium renale TaxID=1724 RepID=A0A2A9DPA3_9CORY|nr:YetF domain-containing protein [Corynebacterium renale]PFG28186.1 uncharacterized protein DUF421 [Corynebacterium renale]SQI20089.1 Protein of uncharacterised function (DUF421) [Corynebacterium renale]